MRKYHNTVSANVDIGLQCMDACVYSTLESCHCVLGNFCFVTSVGNTLRYLSTVLVLDGSSEEGFIHDFDQKD